MARRVERGRSPAPGRRNVPFQDVLYRVASMPMQWTAVLILGVRLWAMQRRYRTNIWRRGEAGWDELYQREYVDFSHRLDQPAPVREGCRRGRRSALQKKKLAPSKPTIQKFSSCPVGSSLTMFAERLAAKPDDSD